MSVHEMDYGVKDSHGWITGSMLLKHESDKNVRVYRTGSFYYDYCADDPDIRLYNVFENWLTPTETERTLFHIETGIHYPEQFILDLLKGVIW